MSEVTLENPGFDLPEKPTDVEGLLPITDKAVRWVAKKIKWVVKGGVYRPEKAIEHGDGNCIAQAIAGVAVMSTWGFATGIVYDGRHAHFVVSDGQEVAFGDPSFKKTTKPSQEIAARGGQNELAELYTNLLPNDLSSKRFARYFYEDHVSEDQMRWVHEGFKAFDPGPRVSIHDGNPHVIVDATQGIAMLLAVGDLNRYLMKALFEGDPRYEEKYDAMSKCLPYFASIPKPSEI